MTLIPGIKQISQVGNEMYSQGAFPVSINTTDAAYLADPADTRLLAGHDPVLEEVSVGISGVETDLKYATGPQPLTVTDAMHGNLTSCEVSFSPSQDLHGFDSPWPAGGGVNKFGPNESPTAEAYIKSNGDVATGSTATNWIISDYIPVLAETQYTFNPNSTSGAVAYFAYYDSTTTLISTIVSSTTTFTTPADCAFMRFSYRDSSYDIQLELGSSVSATYTPYANICPISGWQGAYVYIEPTYDPTATPKASVTFGQTVYGGTYDVVSGVGMIEWAKIDVKGTDVFAWRLDLPVFRINCIPKSTYVSGSLTNKIANCLPTVDNNTLYQGLRYGVCEQTLGEIGLAVQGVETLEDMKNWVEENNLQVVYKLATPIPFTTTGAPDITLQDGTNTIWADTNGTDISVTYVTKK